MTKPTALIWLENRINGDRHEVEAGHPDIARSRYRVVSGANPACPTCGALPEATPATATPSPADGDAQDAAPSV